MKRDWMTETVDHGSDVDMAPRGDQKTQGDLNGWWKSVLCELIVLCVGHVVAGTWIASVLCMVCKVRDVQIDRVVCLSRRGRKMGCKCYLY